MQVLPAGPSALLAEPDDPADVPVLYADLRRDVACRDLVPGARTVLLDGPADIGAARTYLAGWRPSARTRTAPAREVEVPTTYDGEDLDDVARLWGMTERRRWPRTRATEFVVAFCGSRRGSPTARACRRATPSRGSTAPPAGAGRVGGAGGRVAGVYPSASPGGWRLLGRTDVRSGTPSRRSRRCSRRAPGSGSWRP